MREVLRYLAVFPLCAVVVISACAQKASDHPSPGTPTSSVAVRLTTPHPPTPSASVDASASAGSGSAVVEMGEHFFAPSVLVVKAGTTVTWRLVGMQTHDVNAFDGSFRSRTLGPGDSFSHTFMQPGRYTYYCIPHYGDGMTGEVVVEAE